MSFLNGYVMLTRDTETGGIYVETADDWEDYMDERPRRMIYCQAVSNMEIVEEKIDRWLNENEDMKYRQEDVNDTIAELISSIQWIANEHPLKSFQNCLRNKPH
jgi:hypothetical protein